MYPETIENKTKRVLEKIKLANIAKQFYLAGGTALAFYLGHRESIDLDWFSDGSFSNADLKKELSLINPLVNFEGVNLASEQDIAAIKIDAISSRGSKKDFIDIYFLLQKYSLAELFGLAIVAQLLYENYAGISKLDKRRALKLMNYMNVAPSISRVLLSRLKHFKRGGIKIGEIVSNVS